MNRISVRPSTFHACLLFLVLAIAWSWPLPTRLGSRFAHDAADPGLNAWILWWNTQAIPFSERWWNARIFYPMRDALALSEHLAGVALFTSPLQFAGVNATGAYNAALIASSWLSGFFAFLLGRRLTGSFAAGVATGAAFAFAPYRASQLSHLQVLTAQWMPLALFAMHSYVDEGRRRWLLLFSTAWLVQALSNGYYLLFFPVLLGLWFAWFGVLRAGRGAQPRRDSRRLLALAATFAASSLLLLPVLLRYRNVHDALGLVRDRGEMLMFSASPSSFGQSSGLLLWGPPQASANQEGLLYPGATALVLCAIGLAIALIKRRTGSPVLFYAIATVVMAWLALGPAETDSFAGFFARPYTALTLLPGFEGLRAPARFAMLATLCLAVICGSVVARILEKGTRWRTGAAAFIVIALLADGWIRGMPLATPPPRIDMPRLANAIVLELPALETNVRVDAMLRSVSHQLPLVNGYSGHTPRHYAALLTALQHEDPSVLLHLARGRPLVIVVHRMLDPDGALRAYVERSGATLQQETGVGPVFVLAPQPREPVIAIGPGLAARVTRDDQAHTTADLGTAQTVRAVAFNVRWRHGEVNARMTIETSTDGNTWATVWENWTGGLMLAAAIENERDLPVRITLPDASARYVRLSPTPRWMEGELTVYGGR